MKVSAAFRVIRNVTVVWGLCHFAGCGSSPATVPVSGQVVYRDGSTLPSGGQVIFTSVDIDPPVTAKGFFGADGKFELSTFSKGDGAVTGKYEVAVLPLVPDDRGNMSQAQYAKAMNPMADRFKSPNSSGLRYTVSAESAPHDFRIEVHPPGRR